MITKTNEVRNLLSKFLLELEVGNNFWESIKAYDLYLSVENFMEIANSNGYRIELKEL